MATQSKALTLVAWTITGLIGLLMTFSATMKFLMPPDVVLEVVGKLGYSTELIFYLGTVEIMCVVVYVIPQTAVLGAVLLTGYLGGATAAHVRVGDAFLTPVALGIFVWLALYLREPRLRALLPIRRKSRDSEPPAASEK